MKTIRVTGKGKIKLHPDTTRLTLTLEGLCKDYEKTLQDSAKMTDELKNLFTEFDFEKSDLKTLSFNIDTEYESYKEKGVYKQRFKGYSFRHVLKIEFDSDNKRLGKILYALAHSQASPEFKISYTVKNPENAKNELLAKAVLDAKKKAELLAKAAEVPLKEIQSIDYSWGEIQFETQPVRMMEEKCFSICSSAESYDFDIEPDDIDAEDTVTVVWEIG